MNSMRGAVTAVATTRQVSLLDIERSSEAGARLIREVEGIMVRCFAPIQVLTLRNPECFARGCLKFPKESGIFFSHTGEKSRE